MPPNVDLDALSDADLVRHTLGDRECFVHLAKRYEQKLLRYIMAISGFRKEDAEDVLQEVFIKTYVNLNGYDPRLSFSSWIYRIAHNETVSDIRKRSVRPTRTIEETDLDRWSDGSDLTKDLDLRIDRARIEETLRDIDVKYRDVLVLRYLEGHSYADIADILRKPINTVGNLIARGKRIFRDAYLTRYPTTYAE
ncbi:RNA polymerase sigma factor [Patescibacteria group bacterium]|nr:RNA polymerase sigma factor [Patescibacteria group bacterium]MBU1448795.1 RNA polymerase sigma factor [Patescibacteria group bacterium]MBU2613596.1 RNA polymerase sigma factor [Patescibacteria group bacterium]